MITIPYRCGCVYVIAVSFQLCAAEVHGQEVFSDGSTVSQDEEAKFAEVQIPDVSQNELLDIDHFMDLADPSKSGDGIHGGALTSFIEQGEGQKPGGGLEQAGETTMSDSAKNFGKSFYSHVFERVGGWVKPYVMWVGKAFCMPCGVVGAAIKHAVVSNKDGNDPSDPTNHGYDYSNTCFGRDVCVVTYPYTNVGCCRTLCSHYGTPPGGKCNYYRADPDNIESKNKESPPPVSGKGGQSLLWLAQDFASRWCVPRPRSVWGWIPNDEPSSWLVCDNTAQRIDIQVAEANRMSLYTSLGGQRECLGLGRITQRGSERFWMRYPLMKKVEENSNSGSKDGAVKLCKKFKNYRPGWFKDTPKAGKGQSRKSRKATSSTLSFLEEDALPPLEHLASDMAEETNESLSEETPE